MRGATSLRGGLALLVLLLAGCSIKPNVTPVTSAALRTTEICVRENGSVRAGFLEAYRQALEARGFSVRVIDSGAGVTACPLLTTYLANWRWDFTMYMAYAEMIVYRDGQEAGRAVYDALLSGGRMDKFINADEKVRELTAQLFHPR